MSSVAIARRRTGVRAAEWDVVFVGLSLLHGIVLLGAPSIAVVTVGLWWNANTISHNFIHRPFFRGRAANRIYSAYLTLLLGVPQSVWRYRHLHHHGARQRRFAISAQVVVECLLVLALW